jgi:DNA-binding CsgD family transcriptional regulator
VARLRDRLGGDRFDEVWEGGRGLGPAAMVAEAEAVAASLATGPAAGAPAAGPAGLSEREREVLRLVAAGLTSAQVAERLFLSPRTINADLNRIYAKLNVTTRGAAVRFAVEHGLV